MKAYGLMRGALVRALTLGLVIAMTACAALASAKNPAPTRTKGSASASAPSGKAGKAAPAPARAAAASQLKPKSEAVVHVVKRGETLYRISVAYGVSVRDLSRANGITNPSLVKVGAKLTIPSAPAAPGQAPQRAPLVNPQAPLEARAQTGRPAAAPASSETAESAKRAICLPPKVVAASIFPEIPGRTTSKGAPNQATMASVLTTDLDDPSSSYDDSDESENIDLNPSGVNDGLVVSAEPFAWPVQGGMIFSPFGPRRGRQHAGIDIAAPSGSLVYAARDGEVVFSGRKRGYGNVIILDHGDGFASLYAHNSKNLARLGQKVVLGQTIARVGATGNATGSHCHFEIRRDNVALNPSRYINPSALEGIVVRDTTAKPSRATKVNKAGIFP